MGPLVPEIFGNEFNFVIALIIGFFFGFILEQAGFSSSKKLAGLFYGYDFVVLRVFFTAGITAMIGVVLFGYLGWLDLSAIYINPTFLYSAIIGGLIMGAGFIIGGFCPGTSVAAAAIGKIDAMVFVFGTFIGVFFFAEFYSAFEPIFNGSNYGEWKINEALGMSAGLFVFVMVGVAFAAFYFTSRIEDSINKVPPSNLPFFKQEQNKFIPFAAIYLVAGAVLIFLPTHEEAILSKLEKSVTDKNTSIKTMNYLELAHRIVNEDKSIIVVDVRSEKDTIPKALPGAVKIPFDKIMTKEWTEFIKKSYKTIVFTDFEGNSAEKSMLYAKEIGNERATALGGGLKLFYKEFDEKNVVSSASISGQNSDEESFKQKVPAKLVLLREKYANQNKPQAGAKKKKAGGC